uniref:Uncharacterized protein n=1 Tax=Aegilops tauschii subsp. strangulata TaxID=200361 RepID=A0A453NE46_AEGTS
MVVFPFSCCALRTPPWTAVQHLRTPMASRCDGPSLTKNKFNIVVDTWPTYQILN